VIEILDCEQGSELWFQCRAGIPTASEFSTVMARGKDGGASITRLKYMRQLAGEILTGEPAPEGYSNAYMARGHELEDEARSLYAFMRDAEPQRVGFIRNGQKGASPDSLIGDTSGLEKDQLPVVGRELRAVVFDLPSYLSEHRPHFAVLVDRPARGLELDARASRGLHAPVGGLGPVGLTVGDDDSAAHGEKAPFAAIAAA